MRRPLRSLSMVAQMVARAHRPVAAGAVGLAARLHDASAGLAVGIGLLKGSTDTASSELLPDPGHAIQIFEQVLAELRQLSRTVSARPVVGPRSPSVLESLKRDATVAGVELELTVIGREDWLTSEHLDLLLLAGRESIRNVKRHSGARRCRVTIDVSTCPFVLSARDWGSGIRAGTRVGAGIGLLDDLATEMGAALDISSQPGLGMELTLTGPRCVLTRGVQPTHHRDDLRSVVADESPGSRKRVAARRPFRAPEQQIT
jgi:signal transduction histidine kinase